MNHLLDLLQPWHLIVLAVVAFLVFGAMGRQPPSGPRKGPPWKTS
jgi:hypothetical protein